MKIGGVTLRPLSADHSATQWREASQHSTHRTEGQTVEEERRPVSTGELEIPGLVLLSDLCSKLDGSPQPHTRPETSSSWHSQVQLDPKFCSDLVSRKTKEVYPYPSPLHAVALQSPLFTFSQEDNSSPSQSSPNPGTEQVEDNASPPLKKHAPTSLSLSELEQYISRLVYQYHSRARPDLSGHGLQKSLSVSSQDAFQARSPLDSHGSASSLLGAGFTPCKLGNSSRVRLSSISKKASRNSINLGNLPSVTGEDFNISFHLNLNLNLNPNLNKSLDAKSLKEDISASCGYLGANTQTLSASPSTSSLSFTPTPTPTPRSRPRISTCPSQVNHRGSLEVTGKVFGPMGFSRSLDWSGGAPREEAEGCPPPSKPKDGPLKLTEDSEVVCEISRVSGLPCSVVVGLMEEGVELDTDCFQMERERGEGSASPSQPFLSQSPQLSHHASASPDLAKSHSCNMDSNPWISSCTTVENSQQRCLQICHSESYSARTSQSASPTCSERSAPTPNHCVSRISPALSIPQTPVTPDPSSPGSTASVPCHARVHSPPRLLSSTPFTPAQLSVFRRDAPSQCSLPRYHADNPTQEGSILRPRGGSLRQEAGAGWRSQDRGWRQSENGERLYQGKHASRELVRAATVSSYSSKDYSTGWDEDVSSQQTPKKGSRFWRGFEGRFWGKDGDSHNGEKDGRSGKKKDSQRQRSRNKDQELGQRRTTWKGHSANTHSSRRALFRSESQGFLEPISQQRKSQLRTSYWSSSFEIANEGHAAQDFSRVARTDKHLSSTASLFHLSRSQSLEGSCQSLSPLSSPSYSPSPPPAAPLTRSRSVRDLGRRVFGSMRSLSLRGQKSKS